MARILISWLIWVGVVSLCGIAQADTDCGSLTNAYGPFDYTNPEHFNQRLPIVTGAHFTSKVESLIGGQSGELVRDIDYTLRAFPNHHRALHAMSSLQLRSNFRVTPPIRTADCYFLRALRFKPEDSTVRMLYGIYLHKRGRFDEAIQFYNEALAAVPDDIETHYNLGLLYCDIKDFPSAKIHAQKAYAAGYPLPGLRNRLIKAGAWNKESGKNDVN